MASDKSGQAYFLTSNVIFGEFFIKPDLHLHSHYAGDIPYDYKYYVNVVNYPCVPQRSNRVLFRPTAELCLCTVEILVC